MRNRDPRLHPAGNQFIVNRYIFYRATQMPSSAVDIISPDATRKLNLSDCSIDKGRFALSDTALCVSINDVSPHETGIVSLPIRASFSIKYLLKSRRNFFE